MYHIKNDKRSKTSANLIYNALEECLKKKPFDKITITDIQNTSTVGRSTFYRNFDSLIDVLKWKSDESFEDLFQSFIQKVEKDENVQLIPYFFEYWFHNSDILELLLSIHHQDIIYNSFLSKSEMITNYYKETIDFPQDHFDYFIAIRIGIFISILMTWIKNGKKETPKEITNILLEQRTFISQSNILL